MKTIKVKKENFNLDGICNEIEKSISSGALECEGTIHPAIFDCVNNKTLFATSYYDEYDYNTVKELFYEGEMGLVLPFATENSDSYKIGCANDKEYNTKNMELGVFGIDYASIGAIYLETCKEYIYISTAYYGGASCTGPARIVIEENWGEFDKIVLDFIKPFINKIEGEELYQETERSDEIR